MRMPDLVEKVGPIIMLIGVILSIFGFIFYISWSSETNSGTIFIVSLFYLALAVLSIVGLILDLRGKKFGNIFPLVLALYMLWSAISNWTIGGVQPGTRYGINVVYIVLPPLLLVIVGSIINLVVYYYRQQMTK